MATGVKLQLRVTIEHPEGDRDPKYVVEGQHICGKKTRMDIAYADHADLAVHLLEAGALLTGMDKDEVAVFLPEHWDEIVMGAKLEGQ